MIPRPIHVVLVDDHRILLDALAARIGGDPQFVVDATAVDAETGLKLVLQYKPQVAIFDVELPGRGVFEVVGEIASRQKDTRVLFLTGFMSDIFISQALRLNASGYLMKGEPLEKVLEAIRLAAMGQICFSEQVRSRLEMNAAEGRYRVASQTRLNSLTPRQLEVLRYLAHGQSVKEVARRMHLSEKSIDSHKYRIMHKLGIHDRVELARYAIREGLTLP